MKIKYIVYTILILGFGALVAYRITQNKSEGAGGPGGGGKGPGGPGGGGPAMRRPEATATSSRARRSGN